MGNYYFLAPSLPPLVLEEKPEISFEELMHRLKINLSETDMKKVEVLKRYVDLQNIRQMMLEEGLDPRGNLSEKELDEALLIQDILPAYVFDFLGQFEEKAEKVRHFFGLLSRYFKKEMPKREGFLKRYLSFQREWRLVLLAIRAKKLKSDLLFQLQFEDFSDPLVALILAQKDTEDFEPPIEYEDLKQRLIACGNDPWAQYVTVMQYQLDKIEELSGYPLFSIDWILGYVARLMIIEKFHRLDEEKGKSIVRGYKHE